MGVSRVTEVYYRNVWGCPGAQRYITGTYGGVLIGRVIIGGFKLKVHLVVLYPLWMDKRVRGWKTQHRWLPLVTVGCPF